MGFKERFFALFSLVNLLLYIGLLGSGCIAKNVQVEVSPEDIARANELAQQGNAAFIKKEFYPALIKYLEAARLNPNEAVILNRLGITYSQLKYYHEAVGAFQRSIAANKKYGYPVNNIGSAYFALRELKKAERSFKKAIRMNGGEASFHMNLGALYLEKKKLNKALSEWRKALELNPEGLENSSVMSLPVQGQNSSLSDKQYLFARVFASQNNSSKAIEYLEKAVLNGFSDLIAIEKQPDFDPMRKQEAFVEFMKKAQLIISEKKEQKKSPSATIIR
jgi:tetratricopeptide (TPR) repeat protein